ncbi:MAG: gliding motility-associated transport system ATP-binding protein [Candidatus Sumerlaeota bacterium]|nr:gliding motility-associated transport system ATP-binding protein [Candidatus Sumerlaeota bacterium]
MRDAMEIMVELQKLTKHFGPIRAADEVSFSVRRGEVLGFLGPNGAGKSTTMKMLTCYLAPTSGTARVCGHDILTDSIAVRRKLGYLPEGAPAYPDMTPLAFLRFAADVRGICGAERRKAIDRAVELTSLQGVLKQPIDTLSKGFKRRVGLAQAILHDPEVLVLDEPTDGLDPNQKYEVRQLIAEMAGSKAIILSTHILEEVEAVCSRAVIIARGKVIFDGTPVALEAKSKWHNAVTVRLGRKSAADAADALRKLEGVSEVLVEDGANDAERALTVFSRNGNSIINDVADLARSKEWRVLEMRTEHGRLDEVFRDLTAAGKEAK